MAAEIGSMTGPDGQPTILKQVHDGQVGTEREIPVWERDDAPPGSTKESLLVFEGGRAVRVAGPTHYQHLADGRVVGGFGGGTHYSEPDGNGGEKITRIVANHEG
jgi:hypothetical protein